MCSFGFIRQFHRCFLCCNDNEMNIFFYDLAIPPPSNMHFYIWQVKLNVFVLFVYMLVFVNMLSFKELDLVFIGAFYSFVFWKSLFFLKGDLLWCTVVHLSVCQSLFDMLYKTPKDFHPIYMQLLWFKNIYDESQDGYSAK